MTTSIDLLTTETDLAEALLTGLDEETVNEPVITALTREDFDFDAVVETLCVRNVDVSLETLELDRLEYTKAARAEGRKNPDADFYNAVNAPLFRLRTQLGETVDRIEKKKRKTVADKETLRCAHRDIEALTELLVKFNYGMTRNYVRRFTSNTSQEDSADMQAAAVVGLMHAIHTFDPAKGRFGSWAFKPIQRAVLKAVRDADFANMTHGDFERRPLILRAWERLGGANADIPPSFEQIAAEAGVTVELVQRVIAAPHLDSLHISVGEEGDTELGDLIPDDGPDVDAAVISALEIDTLRTFGLPVLDPRERYVVVCRYGLHGEPPEALSDIGKQLGLSREAVRQINGKALARLLHPMVLGVLCRGGRQ